MLSEFIKPLKGLAPAADRFNTSPATDWFNTENYERITFQVYHQGGTTGKATITAREASDVSGTGAAAIAFKYRRMTTGDSDTLGDISAATSAGIDTVPGEDTIIEIEVDARSLTDGKPFVSLLLTEAVNDPVNGAVFAQAHGPQHNHGRYVSGSMPTAIA